MAKQAALRILTLKLVGLASLAAMGQLGLHNELTKNGSFEEITRCPDGYTSTKERLVQVLPWTQPTKGTADLFNECSRNHESKASFNFFGFQAPFEGLGYVGVLAGKEGGREYITQEIVHQLSKDSTYQIELWVSLADNSRWASDSVGIGFTTTPPHSTTSGALTCDTLLLSQGAITDTTNWVPLRFTYTARGTERHIVIGCFSRSSKGFIRTGRKRKPLRDWAYYYVDAVSVRLIPSR